MNEEWIIDLMSTSLLEISFAANGARYAGRLEEIKDLANEAILDYLEYVAQEKKENV